MVLSVTTGVYQFHKSVILLFISKAEAMLVDCLILHCMFLLIIHFQVEERGRKGERAPNMHKRIYCRNNHGKIGHRFHGIFIFNMETQLIALMLSHRVLHLQSSWIDAQKGTRISGHRYRLRCCIILSSLRSFATKGLNKEDIEWKR